MYTTCVYTHSHDTYHTLYSDLTLNMPTQTTATMILESIENLTNHLTTMVIMANNTHGKTTKPQANNTTRIHVWLYSQFHSWSSYLRLIPSPHHWDKHQWQCITRPTAPEQTTPAPRDLFPPCGLSKDWPHALTQLLTKCSEEHCKKYVIPPQNFPVA